MKVLGRTGFPEIMPTHVYIQFQHFFELHKLMEDMINYETTHPGITKYTKNVMCHYERDMYKRELVHKDMYSACCHCRNYVENLENKAVWWFDVGKNRSIRLTFKNFIIPNSFECNLSWIKVVGTMELELKLESAMEEIGMRRNYRVVRTVFLLEILPGRTCLT